MNDVITVDDGHEYYLQCYMCCRTHKVGLIMQLKHLITSIVFHTLN